MSNLKQKTLNGLLWSAIDKLSLQGIQFILGIILARILLPADYGLIGMLAIFMSISQSFIDSGFSQSLIQKKKVTQTDYSTIFYFNIVVALFFYLIVYLSSGSIASFYKEPILEKLIKFLGLNFIINSFSLVLIAKLTKELNFKTQTKASLTSILISGSVSIYLAYSGWGVWSLICQTIIRNGTNVFVLFILTKWKPLFTFSKKSFNSLFPFGSKLLISGILNAIFNNLYLITIGKFYNAKELGFYTRANQFQQLPSETFTIILQRVTFPVLSSIQDEDERLQFYYKKFIRLAAFFIFPIMIGIASISFPLINVVLTKKWIEISSLLKILCLVGMLYPIHAINLNILKVKGRSDLFLKLEIIKKTIIIITLFITFSYGIKIIIIGQLVCSYLFLYVNTFYTQKIIKYTFIDQLKDLIPIFLLSLSMGYIVHISISLINSQYLQIIIGIIVGSAYYYIVSKIFKFTELNDVIKLIKNKL